MKKDIQDVLAQYEGLITAEDLRLYLSSVHLLKNATNGWGEITLDFKAGETKEARITLTQKPAKPDSGNKV